MTNTTTTNTARDFYFEGQFYFSQGKEIGCIDRITENGKRNYMFSAWETAPVAAVNAAFNEVKGKSFDSFDLAVEAFLAAMHKARMDSSLSPKIVFGDAAENESQALEIDGVAVGNISYYAADRENTEDHPLFINDECLSYPIVKPLLDLNGKFSGSRVETQGAIVAAMYKEKSDIGFADGVEISVRESGRGIFINGLLVGWIVSRPVSDDEKLPTIEMRHDSESIALSRWQKYRPIFRGAFYETVAAAETAFVKKLLGE